MTIYDRINDLCIKNNMTGIQLGQKLELKKSPLTDWKNGKSKPTVEQIIKMCDIFAISSEYILFGKVSGELTKDEEELIEAYRKSSIETKNAARRVLNIKEVGEGEEKLSNYKTG